MHSKMFKEISIIGDNKIEYNIFRRYATPFNLGDLYDLVDLVDIRGI